MEHPFVSHRHAIRSCRHGCQMLEDMAIIAAASAVDVRCIAQRRDCDIDDERVRDSVMRHSAYLGRLVAEVGTACAAVTVAVPAEFASLEPRWMSFVTASTTKGDDDLEAAIRAATAPLSRALNEACVEHQRFEEDAGSSSASDYSDTDTDSTSHSRDMSDDEDDATSTEDDGRRASSASHHGRRRR